MQLPFGALSMTESQPLRQVRSDTLGGTDILFWLDREKRAVTVPTYRFQMTSGEIDWRLLNASAEQQKRIPDYSNQAGRLRARLEMMRNILYMPNEPMLFGSGRRNYFTIELYSVLHPDKVTLSGVFGPEGISKTYEGSRPKSMTYEFEFIALQREPDNEAGLASLISRIERQNSARTGAFTSGGATARSTVARTDPTA